MTLWTAACQDLLSKRFSRQEYRSGLPLRQGCPQKTRDSLHTFESGSFPPRVSPSPHRMFPASPTVCQRRGGGLPCRTYFRRSWSLAGGKDPGFPLMTCGREKGLPSPGTGWQCGLRRGCSLCHPRSHTCTAPTHASCSLSWEREPVRVEAQSFAAGDNAKNLHFVLIGPHLHNAL